MENKAKELFYFTLGFIKSFKSHKDDGRLSGKIGPPYNGSIRKYGLNDGRTEFFVYVDGAWIFVRRSFTTDRPGTTRRPCQ